MLSPAFSPPPSFSLLLLLLRSKPRLTESRANEQREKERENWRSRYRRNQMKRTRNGYNGAVSCADTTRETGLFANVDENPRTTWKDYSVSVIGGGALRCGAAGLIVDRSSPPGIGPVVDGTSVWLVIGDLWRPRWRWMLFGHACSCVYVCVCVCRISNGVRANVWQLGRNDFEDLAMVLNGIFPRVIIFFVNLQSILEKMILILRSRNTRWKEIRRKNQCGLDWTFCRESSCWGIVSFVRDFDGIFFFFNFKPCNWMFKVQNFIIWNNITIF